MQTSKKVTTLGFFTLNETLGQAKIKYLYIDKLTCICISYKNFILEIHDVSVFFLYDFHLLSITNYRI